MSDTICFEPIKNFDDFKGAVYKSGMSMGGENNESVFSLSDYFNSDIKWHTEIFETDPWEWRMGVLNKCSDIAYAKLFFKKSGYLTKKWYPYFYAVRRASKNFNDEYEDGKISLFAKKIYDLLCENDNLPLHLIKQQGGFSKEDKSKFDAAIVDLQMKMYVTMCGKASKVSVNGEEYGWSSTVFCRVEKFFEDKVFEAARKISKEDAISELEEHIYKLNEKADKKKVKKFIIG